MSGRASARLLADGRRLHLSDGPIDLVIGASGAARDVAHAYAAATARFEGLLDELCGELTLLRAAAGLRAAVPEGAVARLMCAAVAPLAAETFITPMAAVAGAVAEAILAAMRAAAPLQRAYVNNGGDIALHLAPGSSFRIGLIDRPDRPGMFGTLEMRAADPARGIATSGWRGRSFSLGIADAVTVLAATASTADAAATVIANAVDLPGHPAVTRVPACDLQPDSDLGARLVTRAVGPLSRSEVAEALELGLATAGALRDRGLIEAAGLHLAGETRLVAADRHIASPPPALFSRSTRASEGAAHA